VRGRDSAELRDSFHGLPRRFFVQVYDADRCAMFGEAKGDCLTYTTSPAGYQGDLVVQTESAHACSTFVQPCEDMKWPLQRSIGLECLVSMIKIIVSLFEMMFC
jgi:hypothetical protein